MRLTSNKVGVQTMNLSTRTVGVIGMTLAMMMITLRLKTKPIKTTIIQMNI
jgi:hypothetical protein